MTSNGLNRVSGHPLHRQVADRLRNEILAGKLAAGAKLPTERELGERFGVHRETLRRALARLRAEGWLESIQGSGNYVREQLPPTSIDLLLEVDSDHRGVFLYRHAQDWDLLQPTRIERESASADVARRLDVDPGSPVLVRDRLIGPEGGPPGQLATTYLPGWLVEQLPRLAEPDTGPTGFLGLIEAAGYRLRWTVTVATRMPLPAEQTAFQLGQGQPVLRLLRTTYDAATDRPVEITDYRLPGPWYEVTVPLLDRRESPEPAPVESDLAD